MGIPQFKSHKIDVKHSCRLADSVTPVALYLRARQKFKNSLLLESADYRGAENSFSYILFDPIARFEFNAGQLSTEVFGETQNLQVQNPGELVTALQAFIQSFEIEKHNLPSGVINGLFGYLAYDVVDQFENIKLNAVPYAGQEIPQAFYQLYRFIIAINHYKSELHIIENCTGPSQVSKALELLDPAPLVVGKFKAHGSESSNLTDEQHKELVLNCKKHIARGDVFQIVPSRKFARSFEGDDFQVYRALRSLNPSPYLFYYDCGGFRLFGSSPEAQIVIKNGQASIYPIAGTYGRTGDEQEDRRLAEELSQDAKENAEHVMLVDLARNDLSVHCYPVHVEKYREVQFYSHVIHLVSKVVGKLDTSNNPLNIVASTFPAGTLSGAPKYRAMQLIDQYEGVKRHFYGGAIGYFGFNGESNHAIMIRSFLSKDGVLHSQAGSGVVADSVPEREVDEVKNKLRALTKAIDLAGEQQS